MSNLENIIQYGVSRTGSKLLHRCLSLIFPHKEIDKRHPQTPLPPTDFADTKNKIVISSRNPIDSFLSWVRVEKHPTATELVLDMEWDWFDIAHRLMHYENIRSVIKESRGNILLMKYEEFYSEFGYIFNAFEKFFDIKIPANQRAAIEEEVGIDNAMLIQKKMNTFSDHDKESGIHGNHILTPTPNEGRRLIKPEALKGLEEVFSREIEEWRTGYEMQA